MSVATSAKMPRTILRARVKVCSWSFISRPFANSDHYLTSGKERAQTPLFDQGDSTEPESEGEIQVLAKKDAQKLRKRTCPALTSQWL